MATVKCPTCSRLIEWGPDFPYRPFCSERCKMVDLGAWLAEERRIPGPTATTDFPDDAGDDARETQDSR